MNMITRYDVERITLDYQLSPPLTLTLARQLTNERFYEQARRALTINYGDDIAASVESAILQAADH